MKIIKFLLFIFLWNIFSCNEIKPRKPLNNNKNSFFKSSIKRNIKIRLKEENVFKEIINNSKKNFIIQIMDFGIVSSIKMIKENQM